MLALLHSYRFKARIAFQARRDYFAGIREADLEVRSESNFTGNLSTIKRLASYSRSQMSGTEVKGVSQAGCRLRTT
jgi:hypothetical protein